MSKFEADYNNFNNLTKMQFNFAIGHKISEIEEWYYEDYNVDSNQRIIIAWFLTKDRLIKVTIDKLSVVTDEIFRNRIIEIVRSCLLEKDYGTFEIGKVDTTLYLEGQKEVSLVFPKSNRSGSQDNYRALVTKL